MNVTKPTCHKQSWSTHHQRHHRICFSGCFPGKSGLAGSLSVIFLWEQVVWSLQAHSPIHRHCLKVYPNTSLLSAFFTAVYMVQVPATNVLIHYATCTSVHANLNSNPTTDHNLNSMLMLTLCSGTLTAKRLKLTSIQQNKTHQMVSEPKTLKKMLNYLKIRKKRSKLSYWLCYSFSFISNTLLYCLSLSVFLH